MKDKNSGRIAYFDFLRGIAIFMVIGIHTFNLVSLDGKYGEVRILFRQVIGFAVPLFLAISGYFLARKKKQEDYFPFLKKQLLRVYVPVLIWSLPYLVSGLCKGYNPVSVLGLYLLCGFSVYYFVALIMQYYILLPVLGKFNNSGGVILSCLITALAVSVASYCVNVKGMSLYLVLYAGPFPVWMAFFVAGMWLGGKPARNYKLWPFVLLGVAGLVLCYVETKWLQGFHGRGVGLKLSSQLYSFAAVMILFSDSVQQKLTSGNFLFRFFEKVGVVSFGVYLTHMFVIDFMVKCGIDLGWLPNTVLVLLLTAGAVFGLRKMLPPKFVAFLGFK